MKKSVEPMRNPYQKYYQKPLTPQETFEIRNNLGAFFEILRDMEVTNKVDCTSNMDVSIRKL